MPALRRALYVSFLATAIYGCSSEPTAPTPTPSQSKTDLRAWSTLYTQVDLGLLVGELFDLDELADDCAADGSYAGLFVAAPMPIVGASGSPLNPLFMK